MDFIKVEESKVNILYDLNFQLLIDENQKDLFTASRSSYSSAFLGSNPISFGFLGFMGKKSGLFSKLFSTNTGFKQHHYY